VLNCEARSLLREEAQRREEVNQFLADLQSAYKESDLVKVEMLNLVHDPSEVLKEKKRQVDQIAQSGQFRVQPRITGWTIEAVSEYAATVLISEELIGSARDPQTGQVTSVKMAATERYELRRNSRGEWKAAGRTQLSGPTRIE